VCSPFPWFTCFAIEWLEGLQNWTGDKSPHQIYQLLEILLTILLASVFRFDVLHCTVPYRVIVGDRIPSIAAIILEHDDDDDHAV
jgi:hypothetical protein